jgi:hypothetical protein
MNAKELLLLIGKKGQLMIRPGCTTEVEVVDARQVFGRTDYQVKPVAGSGECWVEAMSVVLK